MKKKVWKYLGFGFISGIFISQTILLLISSIISISIQKNIFSAAPPQLIEQMGNELYAAILQYFLAGILGAGFSVSSLVWQMESWSPLKQTLVHFAILSCIMLPIAWLTYWMQHTVVGVLIYFGIFIAIYVVIYFIIALSTKAKIKKMNQSLQKKH